MSNKTSFMLTVIRNLCFVCSWFLAFFMLSPVFAEVQESSQNDVVYYLLNADYKKGLNESNVLNIQLGKTSRKEVEKYFGRPFNKSKDEYYYQSIKANGLYNLDKKVDYVAALPLMFLVGFPESEKISVDEHPDAYDDYQCLLIGFDIDFRVDRVIYKNFRNILYQYTSEDGQIVRCYSIVPPMRPVGWRQCAGSEVATLPYEMSLYIHE